MHQFLLVICGLPASGKTTLANELISFLSGKYSVAIVSTDTWRDDEYYSEFKPENEGRVRKRALEETDSLLSQGRSVIHDDTNYYTSMRHELFDLAQRYRTSFGIAYVSTPLNICLQWNKDRQFNIPEDVIHRIEKRFDIPGEKYAWDQYMINLDLSNIDMNKAIGMIIEELNKLHPIEIEELVKQESISDLRDRMTRQIVSKFLEKNKELQRDDRVHVIRKQVLQNGNLQSLDVEKTLEKLRIELEKLVRK
jgi:O-phosphoseryl-tRNA(Sec) kinase